MKVEDKLLIAMNQLQINTIVMEKQNENIKELMIKNKQLEDKISKAQKILKEHFQEEYIRSCDTADGIGCYQIDTDCWEYQAYEILGGNYK